MTYGPGRAVTGDRGGLPQRLQDRQALADQAGHDLVDALQALGGQLGLPLRERGLLLDDLLRRLRLGQRAGLRGHRLGLGAFCQESPA
jgi:hypothetical protein